MKRGSLLRRDPVKLLAWRRRSTPLAKVSARQRRFNAEFARARDVVRERANFTCEARLPGCTTFATDVHHIAGRVGPDANSHEGLLALCRWCHREIHANPSRSYGTGHMAKRNVA